MLKAVFLIALAGIASASPLVSVGQSPFSTESDRTDAKVNVTLYVMSRCPDAVSLAGSDIGVILMVASLRECFRRCIPGQRNDKQGQPEYGIYRTVGPRLVVKLMRQEERNITTRFTV